MKINERQDILKWLPLEWAAGLLSPGNLLAKGWKSDFKMKFLLQALHTLGNKKRDISCIFHVLNSTLL